MSDSVLRVPGLDRPLTERGGRSSVPFITRHHHGTRFTNHYDGETSRGPFLWREVLRCVLYVANWEPITQPSLLAGSSISRSQSSMLRREASLVVAGLVIVSFFPGRGGDGEWDDGSGGSPLSSRSGMTSRAAIIERLSRVASHRTARELKDGATERGSCRLGALTAPLQALADFLRIDDISSRCRATNPQAGFAAPEQGIEEWIAACPERRDRLARPACRWEEPHLRAELLRGVRESRPVDPPRNSGEAPRTVGELLAGRNGLRGAAQKRKRAAPSVPIASGRRRSGSDTRLPRRREV